MTFGHRKYFDIMTEWYHSQHMYLKVDPILCNGQTLNRHVTDFNSLMQDNNDDESKSNSINSLKDYVYGEKFSQSNTFCLLNDERRIGIITK